MSSLINSGSATWGKIRDDLEKENNIGCQLELKCEIHGNITLVKRGEDFRKVPEGGCVQMCQKVLPCEHNCQRICHSYDRDHTKYNCTLPCRKTCPNGHPCRQLCYRKCGNCLVKVEKYPPCGHAVNIRCHISIKDWECVIPVERELPCGHMKILHCKIDPQKYLCNVKVERSLLCGHTQISNCFEKVDSISCRTLLQETIPKCGHEVQIQCYMKGNTTLWKCQKLCDIQLDCGHTCGNICHSDRDPRHKDHVCTKPCGRMCSFEHTCLGNHKCFEECPKCEVFVEKKLPCGHKKNLKCYTDENSVSCLETCGKKLACSHKCKQRCWETCLCEVMVKKISVDCSHKVEVKCHETPKREFCDKAVLAKIPSPCGHAVWIPCKLEKSATPEDLLKYCKHPCDEIITIGNCGHKCKGNCSSCLQGRIHKRCEEKCGRNLPCGHECKFPCAALCPPCKQKCDIKCEHSKCIRECGFPCSGCNEPCKWSCSHEKCTKRCREKCDRKPCNLPCNLRLPKCGHFCIGLCGEVCPPLCRICDSEEVKEIFFGNEDEPDARFIYLEDCKHTIELEGMDKHMAVIAENGISVKKCPKCTTVIQNCKRYGDILRDRRHDILTIKRKINGMDHNIQNKMMEIAIFLYNSRTESYLVDFLNFLRTKCYTARIEYSNKRDIRGDMVSLKSPKISPKRMIDQYLFESLDNMVNWWSNASKDLSSAETFTPVHLINVTVKYQTIFGNLMKRLLPLSQQEIKDFDRELQKVSAWCKLYRRADIENFASFPEATKKHAAISQFLEENEFKVFSSGVQDQFSKYLEELDSLIRDIKTWKEEEVRTRKEIFQAVGFRSNHWYKCPKGHFYVIGDCGQPNQSSTCPECKSQIGGTGQFHQLASGNANAGSEFLSERNIPGPGIRILGQNQN